MSEVVMSHLILIELVLLVTVRWSIVSAQTFMFNQTATGPSVTCRGGSATFTCIVVNDGGFLQPNQWRFSNGTVIRIGNPNHMLISNPMGLVTDLVVSNVDANTSYNCTTAAAPLNFTSTASLTVAGPPSTVTMLNHIVVICTTNVSWSPSISDPVCGPVSYNVMISSSDGVMMMRINDTSYNFTGLTPGTDYTVSVAGMNMAGVGQSDVMMFRVPTVLEALPSTVTNLRNTTYSHDKITVTWDAASSPYCGDVLYYEVMISSDEYSNIPNNITNVTMLTTTFSNLRISTRYNISVVAVNRAGTGMASTSIITTFSLSSADDGCDDGLSTGAAVAISIVVAVVTLVVTALISVIITSTYYKYHYELKEKVKVDDDKNVNTKQKDPYGGNIIMDTNPAYGTATSTIKMDTNPAYAATTY